MVLKLKKLEWLVVYELKLGRRVDVNTAMRCKTNRMKAYSTYVHNVRQPNIAARSLLMQIALC